MKCEPHGTDGCEQCKPAMAARWTLGDFRRATAELPDDTPLAVNAADPDYPGIIDEQVITGGGFGTVNWGDGYGDETTHIFGLDCHRPEDYLLTKPDRPPKTAAKGGGAPR